MTGQALSIDDVAEALVECHELWRRSPGGGRWPFAGDAPWHLIQGEAGDIAGATSETLIEAGGGKVVQALKLESVRPRVPLDTGEVARRDEVTGWLGWLADPLDRRLVWLATRELARGEARVGWTALAARLGWGGTARGLAMRYRRALAVLVCRANGWPARRAKALVAGDGLVVAPEAGSREVRFAGEVRQVGRG